MAAVSRPKQAAHAKPLAFAAAAALVLGLGAMRWHTSSAASSGGKAPAPAAGANLLLISIDTLRADHLSPYGYSGVEMPTIARLAREGVRFRSAYSAVPMTLPSHSSIFTGLIPPAHGVRDNGGFYLDASRRTLAETMKGAGYSTAAFVSAFVLDSRWGLARGFDTYHDGFAVSSADLAAMARIQRPAEETWAEARTWLGAHASERFFVWIHFFDPHAPYTPPEPFRSRYATRPYDGEIAYVDSVLGQVVAELEMRGLLEKTLIVVVSDHGEGLGEHDEDEHGLLTYDSTLHVPWIVRLPGRAMAGRVIAPPVGLVDVFPTISELLGLPTPTNVDGVGRLRLMQSGAGNTDVLYAESLYPRLRFGWGELTSVRSGSFKYIRAPRPELFDLGADPHETVNLAPRRPDLVGRLDQILARMVAAHRGPPAHATQVDAQTVRQLQSLGYVAGSTVTPDPHAELADPKDKTGVFRALNHARQQLDEGRDSPGVAALEAIVLQEPELEAAHRTLREYWIAGRRFTDAERWLQGALVSRPGDPRLLSDLAAVYRANGRREQALDAATRALVRRPDDGELLMLSGELLRDLGRFEPALQAFAGAELHASDVTLPKMQRAQTLIAMGRLDDATAVIQSVLASDPHASSAHYLLAQIAERRDDGHAAETEYRAEIATNPWEYRARFNLAMLVGQRGDHAEELRWLESIPPIASDFGEVYFYLAKALLDAGDRHRFPEAIAAVARGLTLAPEAPSAPLGHYVLADIYKLENRPADAAREAAQGRALERRLDKSR